MPAHGHCKDRPHPSNIDDFVPKPTGFNNNEEEEEHYTTDDYHPGTFVRFILPISFGSFGEQNVIIMKLFHTFSDRIWEHHYQYNMDDMFEVKVLSDEGTTTTNVKQEDG